MNADTHDTAAEDSDQQEFERFADTHDTIDIEAATWVTRRHNGLTEQDEAAFDAWLSADPRHQAAYGDMEDTFGRLRELPQEHVQSLKASLAQAPLATRLPASVATPETPTHIPSPTLPDSVRNATGRLENPRTFTPERRHWLMLMGRLLPQTAVAVGALGALGGGWWGWRRWQGQVLFSQRFATAQGQQIPVQLPDGSRIDLDTATQIAVTLYRDRREVILTEGQALFTVQGNPDRPFHVTAGPVRVTVVGTCFSVRHTQAGLDPNCTRVAVTEGRVDVQRIRSEGFFADSSDRRDTVTLTPGQAVVADAQGHLAAVQVVATDQVAPWQAGRVNFESTPLAQAIAEFDRYAPAHVIIPDPAIAALHVGGSFKTHDLASFLRVLPQQLPVRVVRRDGVIALLSAQS